MFTHNPVIWTEALRKTTKPVTQVVFACDLKQGSPKHKAGVELFQSESDINLYVHKV
jgi:hypothetical protein